MSREVCGICWCPYDEDTGECACAPVQPRVAMNREDIIRMARVAGCHDNGEEFRFVELHYLERFAALVAAAEREECAKVCEDIYTGEEACGDWPTPEMCAAAIRARGQEAPCARHPGAGMTRDDIIRMAQEANRYASNQTGDSYEWHFIRDERFAALVAAAERNKCRYPDCVDSGPDGKCSRWLTGECEGPKIEGQP